MYNRCIHEPTPVITIDGVTYHAATNNEALNFTGQLIVNTTRLPVIVPSDDGIIAGQISYPFKEVVIPWQSYMAPMVYVDFWKVLHKEAKEHYPNVCIVCESGHGKTGTALAALLISCSKKSAIKAVEEVRDKYCNQAVESLDQCLYLQALDSYLNKRKITEKGTPTPSMQFVYKEDE